MTPSGMSPSDSRSTKMLLRRALLAEADMGAHATRGGRYILHRCPTCNVAWSTPCVCSTDGTATVIEPRTVVSERASFIAGGGQFIPRLPGMTDEEWAEFIRQEIAARWGAR